MLYQDELMDPESVAVWVGDFQTDGDFTTYLGQPFERDFGFRLDLDDFPGDSLVLPEKRTLARYNELLQTVSIGRLLSQWCGEDWIHEAERMCLLGGITKAKAMLRFLNLRYRQDLCVHSNAPLKFIGNVPWPAGQQRWENLQSRTMQVPPFPKLKQQAYEDIPFSSWAGRIHLEAWKGFATREELADEFMSFRFSAWPDGDFHLVVESVRDGPDARPTAPQARAFADLLENQETFRDTVLQGIFDAYPRWRESLADMVPAEVVPQLLQAADLKRLINLGTIYIMSKEKDGFVAVGFGFGCKWDEEHGLGVLTHQGKVVEVGAAETAFSELSEGRMG